MSTADEVDVQIQALLSPHGHEAERRAHDQALAFLLEHADEAHPRLLGFLDPAQPYVPVAVVNSLPLFGRADSVPVLEKLMREGADMISLSAGQALGRHPHAEALQALLRGLKHDRDETKVSAAEGLLTRGATKSCQALSELLNDPSYEVRYHVINSAGKLGCLSREDLGEIARNDSEADIRELAAKLMQPESAKQNGT